MKRIILIALSAVFTCALFGCAAAPKGDKTITGIIAEVDADNQTILVINSGQPDSPQSELVAMVTTDTKITAKDQKTDVAFEALQVGQEVSVYTNGAVTLSLPPQGTATAIVVENTEIAEVPTMEGMVADLDETANVPTDVFTIEGTIKSVEMDNGYPMLTIDALPDTGSQHDQMVILISGDTITTGEGETYDEVPLEFTEGMTVSVYTDGTATRSIPPQATATDIMMIVVE